jgi:thioredoxin 1
MATRSVTDGTLDAEVLKSPLPVLIDFWAPWCGVCRGIRPMIDQLATEYDGRLRVVAIDIEASPMAAARFNVRAVPNLIVVKDGKVVEQIVGAVPKGRLTQTLDRALAD